MGMFDTLIVDRSLLPKDERLDNLDLKDFQTKSLGRGLQTYHLKEDGRLYKIMVDSKWIDGDPNAPFPENLGYEEEISRWEEVYPIHGTLYFYNSYPVSDSKNQWFDFVAKFDHSKLVEVKLDDERSQKVALEESENEKDSPKKSLGTHIRAVLANVVFVIARKLLVLSYSLRNI